MDIHESVIVGCRIKSLLWQSGNYACITMDEAHERSTNTDMLLALLKKLIHQRKNPKAVIMSATINLEKFCQYFGTTNVFETKRQISDLQTKYVEEPPTCYDSAAVMLVKQFVANKRKGNVLVFLTSVRDIDKTCAMIRREVRGLKVLPMYSSFPRHSQDLATGGCTSQVCIVATNFAEASLIIPGITYVMGMLFVDHHHQPPTKTMEKMNSLKRNESTAAEAAAIEDGKMNPFFVEQGVLPATGVSTSTTRNK
ncbi:related to ATP-binding protein PRP16 [Fusarium proliferatum]|nr:related to ATP-binding protein PRP16 [Fusarium proliferatum]